MIQVQFTYLTGSGKVQHVVITGESFTCCVNTLAVVDSGVTTIKRAFKKGV